MSAKTSKRSLAGPRKTSDPRPATSPPCGPRADPCDPQKICRGEQKMYADPPMFLLPPGYVPPGPGNPQGGWDPHQDPRLAAMMASQPCKLTKDDLQCGPDDLDCRNNYVLTRQAGGGFTGGGADGCCGMIPALRAAHLRTMRLQIVRGEAEHTSHMPLGGAASPERDTRPYRVAWVPLTGGYGPQMQPQQTLQLQPQHQHEQQFNTNHLQNSQVLF